MSEAEDKTRIRGRLATPEEEAWHEYRIQSEQETPKRLEEAAKYLSGLIAVVFSIFTARNPAFFQQSEHSAWLLLGLGGMLLALPAALAVIFPLRWRQASRSAAGIARAHRVGVRWKYAMLALGAALFVVSLAVLAAVWWRAGG